MKNSLIKQIIFSFLPYISIKKTRRSFVQRESRLYLQPKILGTTQETKLFGFAQYFFIRTCTTKPQNNLFIKNVNFQSNSSGFGLLEVIVAAGLWVFLAAAGIMMTTGSLRINSQSTDNDQAVLLAAEGMDAVKAIKKVGWTTPFLATDCVSGCGVATVSGTWGYSGSTNVVGKFTRQVLVTPVNRDTNENIVEVGGTVDADTYKVESKVTWQRTPVVTGTVSLVSYLTNYVKSIVTTLTGGLLIYGDGTTTPKYRTYDRSANSFSTEQSGVTGAAGRSWNLRTSPTKTEAIGGYITSGGVLQIMCFDGSTWSNEWSVTVGGTATTRRFDIAYETNTGDVVVLYSTNTATTNELAYRTKLGTTGCGTANWSVATNLDPIRTAGIVHWVKMASDVRSSSNLITAIWADAASDLSAMVWNGSGWANEPTAALATTLEVVSAAQDVDDFDVSYESLSGDVMIVFALAVGANGTNGVRYVTCTGGTATCTWSGVLTPATFADDATNLDISSSPISDAIQFASIGNAGSDMQRGYWSGTAWTNAANVDTSCSKPTAGSKKIATGWLVSGSTVRSVIVYNDSNATNVGWYVCTTSSCTVQTDWVPSPTFNSTQGWYRIEMDPVSKDQFMLLVSANTTSFYAKRLVMTATPAFTWSNADGSAALETTLPAIINNPYAFAYWRQ